MWEGCGCAIVTRVSLQAWCAGVRIRVLSGYSENPAPQSVSVDVQTDTLFRYYHSDTLADLARKHIQPQGEGEKKGEPV